MQAAAIGKHSRQAMTGPTALAACVLVAHNCLWIVCAGCMHTSYGLQVCPVQLD